MLFFLFHHSSCHSMQYIILQSPLSSCQNVIVNLYSIVLIFISYFLFCFFTCFSFFNSICFFPSILCSPYSSVLFLTLNFWHHSSSTVSLFFLSSLPSFSLYQPPRRRPSAVWSPCAATNMGRAAVPAWPASWSKWPGSARPPIIATHPAAATGGEDNSDKNQWL